jgi:hypothetical protein
MLHNFREISENKFILYYIWLAQLQEPSNEKRSTYQLYENGTRDNIQCLGFS